MTFEKFNEQITVDDLYRWMDKYEEDPIIDGPFYLESEDEKEFLDSLDKKILNLEDEEDLDLDFLGIGGGQWSDEQEEYLVNAFVDFLNKKGYENEYVRSIERED